MQDLYWKPINGFEEIYEVSNNGYIKSLDRIIYNPHTSKEYFKKGVILKPYNSNGYKRVILCKNGIVKKYSIHRLVAEAFIPNPENKPQVNHINTIKDDNRVENLEWCTSKENIQHAWKNNLHTPTYYKRDECFNTKILDKETDIIKKLYTIFSIKDISIKYNVNYSTIHRIIKGRKK